MHKCERIVAYPVIANRAATKSIALILAVSIVTPTQVHAQSKLANSAWPAFRHDALMAALAPTNGPILPEVKWTAIFGSGQLGSPVIGPDNTIYVPGNVDSAVYATTPDGKPKWIFAGAKGEKFVAPPVVGQDGTLYLGSTDSIFYAVNPNGTKRWSLKLGGAVRYSANIGSDATIYVVADDCQLYAITPQGAINWKTPTFKLPGNGPAIAADGMIYIVAGDFLRGFSPDGKPKFEWYAVDMGPLNGLMVEGKDLIYVTAVKRPAIAAIANVNNNSVLRWRQIFPTNFGGSLMPALGKDGTVYFASTRDGGMFALNHDDGKELWRFTLPGANNLTELIIDDGSKVYIVNDNRGLVSIADGQLRWPLPLAKCAFSPAMGADGTIFVAGDRRLYAVGPKSPAPDIAVVPATLDFGTVCNVGDSLIHVKNLGMDTLRVTSLVFSDPAFSTDHPTAFLVAPVDSEKIPIHFTATRGQEDNGTLSIFSNDPDAKPALLVLHGKGGAPDIVPSATPPEFGQVCVGTIAATQVCISNPGDCVLQVDSLAVLFVSAGLLKGSQPLPAPVTKPILILPKEKFCFDVKVVPQRVGDFKVEVTIFSNAPNKNPISIIIPGTSVPPDIAGATEVFFKTVEVQTCAGTTNYDDQIYVIRNEGHCDLQVDSLSTSNVFSVISPRVPQVVPAGGSLEVKLRFTPTDSGKVTGQLRIVSNDPDESPLFVNLIGRGVKAPAIVVVPSDTLSFGAVQVGSSKKLPVTVKSVGASILVVNRLEILSPVFATETHEFALECGKDSLVTIAFTPPAESIFDATLSILSNDPNEPTVNVILHGQGFKPGRRPIIATDSLRYRFGEVCGIVDLPVKVTNIGDATLTVDSVVVQPKNAGFAVAAAGFALAPKQDTIVTVIFKPTAPNTFSAKLQFFSDAANNNAANGKAYEVELQGKGGAPKIAGSPSVTFPSTNVGSISQQPYYVKNMGSCLLTVASTQIEGAHAKDFRVVNGPINAVVSPGDSLRLTLEFQPTAPDLRQALLVITNSDPTKSRFEVTLNGNGIGQLAVEVDPDSLIFGGVCLGDEAKLCFTLQNISTKRLTVSKILISPPVFTIDKAAGGFEFVLPPGGDTTFCVIFTPREVKEYKDTLAIFSNAINSPTHILLRGSGSAPKISGKNALTFKNAIVRRCVTASYTILGDSHCVLRVDSLTITGNNKSDFNIVASPSLPHVIAKNDSLILSLNFCPTASGTRSAQLNIWSNDPIQQPFVVQLHGIGILGILAAPDSIAFQGVCLGDSTHRQFTVKNVGTAELQITNIRPTSGASFSVFKPSQFNITLGPYGSRSPADSTVIELAFMAKQAGDTNNDLLVIDYTDSVSIQSFPVKLHGFGRDDPGILSLLPRDSLSFTGVLDQAMKRNLTLSNTGCQPLVITRIALERSVRRLSGAGAFRIDTTAFPVTLQRGQSKDVEVRFRGFDFKMFTDSLNIYSHPLNAITENLDRIKTENLDRIKLEGRVLDGAPCLRVASKELKFGEVQVGDIKRLDLEVTNCSAIGRLKILVTQPKRNEFKALPALPDTLTIFPSNPQFLIVKFTPMHTGESVDTLRLVYFAPSPISSAPAEQRTEEVRLQGFGVGAEVYAQPNAFTPNHDGKNDRAKIHFAGYDPESVLLRIYDLRGLEVRLLKAEKVETGERDFLIAWDGLDESGRLELPGAYLWLLEEKGKKIGSGQIVLIR